MSRLEILEDIESIKNKVVNLSNNKISVEDGIANNLKIGNTIITKPLYNPLEGGFLIKTNINKNESIMCSIHLTGNLYKYEGAGVIDTYIETYCYPNSNAPYNTNILCNGYNINPKLFYIDGELCIWIEKWSMYPSLRAEITLCNSSKIFKPQIIGSDMPTYDENSLSNAIPEVTAKMTRTEVLVRPKPNYTIAENRSCIINNILFLSITVTRTDNQNFNKSFALQVGQIDASIRNIWQAIAVGNAYGTAHMMGKEIAVNITSDSNRIYLDGVFVL